MSWSTRWKALSSFNSTEIGLLGWLVLMFLTQLLERYTHWAPRTCILLAVPPVLLAQGIYFRLSPRKMAISMLISLAIIFFGWWLLNLVWK